MLGAGGDSGDVGLVAAARTLPLVVFLLVGGALADRLPRHHVMVAANSLNCVSQGLFAVLALTGHAEPWSMMLLAALGGTGTAFFSPASEGMLLASVRGPQASRAFAFYRVAMHGAGIGGAALGGALVAVIGPGWVLAVDAAAFAAAGARARAARRREDPAARGRQGLAPAGSARGLAGGDRALVAVVGRAPVRRGQRRRRGRRGGVRAARRRGAPRRPGALGARRSPGSARAHCWGRSP